MGMWHVPGLPTTAGNAAIRTRMQIHWSMHFNWSYRSMSFSKTLRLNQRTTVITQSSPRLTLTFRVLNADYLRNIDKTLREPVCILSWKNYYTFLNTFATAIHNTRIDSLRHILEGAILYRTCLGLNSVVSVQYNSTEDSKRQVTKQLSNNSYNRNPLILPIAYDLLNTASLTICVLPREQPTLLKMGRKYNVGLWWLLLERRL